MPRITCRVVCGLSVTMEIFSPTRRLRSVDLPEFGRPTIETNPDLLIFLRSECLESQPLHTSPVCSKNLDFDSSVFDLFPRQRQSPEEFDYRTRHRRAVGIGDQRQTEFFLEN